MRNREPTAVRASVERFVQHMHGAEFSQRDCIFALMQHNPDSVRLRLRELVDEGKLIAREGSTGSAKRYRARHGIAELIELGRAHDQSASCHEVERAFYRIAKLPHAAAR